MKRKSEMGQFLRMVQGGMPTCVQKINNPTNAAYHGKFFFVGSIPYECTEPQTHGTPQIPPLRKSKIYDTEDQAIAAAQAAGATRIQKVDCSFTVGE